MAGTVQVTLKGRLFNAVETRNMFVWHTDEPTPRYDTFAEEAMDKIQNMWATIQDQIIAAAWQSYGLEMSQLVEGHWQPYYETEYVLEGLNSEGDATGYQPAALVRMTTNAFKVAGRKFIAGIAEESTLGGVLIGAALTDFAYFIVEWMTPINASTQTWLAGVVDKNHTFRAFTGGTVGNILSELRRRKPGYGI